MPTDRNRQPRQMTDMRAWAKNQGRGGDAKSVRLSGEFEFFKLKVGTMKIDVIPYVVGKGNPNADAGFVHPERLYYTHRVPNLEGKSDRFCCLAAVFKKKCPVCNYLTHGPGRGNQEEQQALKTQMRQLWNVIEVDDPEKKIRVFDTSYKKGLGEMLAKKIQAVEDYARFADPKNGYTLLLTVEDSGTYGLQITNVEMVPRKKALDDALIDRACCLDECLVEKTYKELEAALLQTPADDGPPAPADDADDEPPARAASKPAPDDDEDDDAPRKTPAPTKAARPDDDDDDLDVDEDSELEPVAKAAPAKPASNGQAKPPAPATGIKVGDRGTFKGIDVTVTKVGKDGRLTLTDDDETEYANLDPAKFKPAAKAAPARQPARAVVDDEEEEEDDD